MMSNTLLPSYSRVLPLLAGLVMLLAVVEEAGASTTVFSDRVMFESQLVTSIVDDYSDPGYASGDQFDDPNFPIDIHSNAHMSSVLGETDYMSTGFDELNIIDHDFLGADGVYCTGCNGSFLLSFTTTSVGDATGVFGAGFDVLFNDTDPNFPDPYHAFVTFGDGSTTDFALPETGIGNPSFFGITSDLLITSIHLGLAGGGSTTDGSFIIDNLTIGGTTTVFSDRVMFESQLGTSIVDDYSDPGYASGDIFDDPNVNFDVHSNAHMSSVLGETDYMSTGFDENNDVDHDLAFPGDVYCAGCNGSFLLSFTTTSVGSATGVFGVGFDVLANDIEPNFPDPYHAFVTFGDGSMTDFGLPAPPSFFGITSDLLITSIHLGLAGGGSTTEGFFVIDNLTIGGAIGGGFCGDGILQVALGEECDDGGATAFCDADCTLRECGDGLVGVTEECDPGTGVAVSPNLAIAEADGCSESCVLLLIPESVEESVGAGGTVTSDTEGTGATTADPVETTVTTPNAGTITIDEGSITGMATAFRFFGQEVEITAPDATASNPLVLVLELDATIIPEGEDETSIAVFKDGIFVPACAGAPGTADPDPCVSARVLQGDGDVEITILTSTASQFGFGSVGCSDPPVPASECNQDALNILLISDKKKNKEKLIFKWLKGSGIGESQDDYGDPTVDASTVLCLYQGAEKLLVVDMKVPPGEPRWKKIPNKGFKYSDKALANSGVKKLLLKGGGAGQAKVMVISKGPLSEKPNGFKIPNVRQDLPPDLEYMVQVQITGKGCWGMSYGEGLATNKNGVFKLKRQGP